MKNILKMLPYVRDQYGRLFTIIGASLVIAALTAYQPQIFKNLVNTVVARGSQLRWSDVTTNLLILVVMSVITIVASYLFNVASNRTFQAIRSELKRKIFVTITSLSADYFDTNRPGTIIQKSNEAINSFAGWVNSLNYSLLGPIFTMIIVTAILFKASYLIGSLGLAIIVYSSYSYQATRKRTKEANKRWRQYNETSSAIFSETIQNISTIGTLSNMKRFHDQHAEAERKGLNEGYFVRDTWQASGFRLSLFNELAFLSAITLIVYYLIHAKFSPGEFVAITAYFNSLRQNARIFAEFIPDTDRVENDVERLVELLETTPTFPDFAGARPLRQLRSIEFRNVSFTYPDGKKGAINDISFRIDKMRSVALVGPSGVGKSTITKLLLRFYPPTSGEILINNKPAETYTHESIRQHIGMVMQDVALFNTTIKENLKLANPKASKAELEDASSQAHASEFIDELPKQFNTLVGERGVKLSGGQKQRIAIARAILKNPDLIILDEATSALDSESERLVQDGLKRLMKGRLSLTIAHRLSTVRHAGEIIVLSKGTIAERGTHDELIQKQTGLYRKLFELQSATGKISL
ncbi:MAG: ABC transporter ATP-binding protein [bacterium]